MLGDADGVQGGQRGVIEADDAAGLGVQVWGGVQDGDVGEAGLVE
ncbi:MAG TPA: hypothetical protein VFV66_21725 [Nonomuraea sp.]|nr:hypothetical protein [Nonomuraea sp.]